MVKNNSENLQQNEDEQLESEGGGLVNIVPGKPGLDPKNGRYRILGGVTFGPIFTRPTSSDKKKSAIGSPFAKLAGFKVAEYEVDKDGNVLRNDKDEPIVKKVEIITKQEAVYYASLYGMQNAHIDSREREVKDDVTHEVIKKYSSVYLYPYPRRSESFFKEDRAITAYEVDAKGKIANPIKLLINEDECSYKFWRALQHDYESKQERFSKRKNQVKYKEKMSKLIEAIKQNNAGLEDGIVIPKPEDFD